MFQKKKTIARALVIILELFVVGIIIYLIALPFYPKIKYEINYNRENIKVEAKDLEKVKEKVQEYKKSLPESAVVSSPESEAVVSPSSKSEIVTTRGNRLIISKIGVNAPIIESENEDYGLARGSWRVPKTSTPDKGGNTVITGHRFKYLPPNNVTFYLLDKLEAGDIVSVIWDDKEYYYTVKERKIVDKTESSILDSSLESILTLFTCDPIYSETNRLVVVAELI